ncbi:MAG: energy-coupling factor transporter transmembrane component T [Candidatus Eisenbacteria bacterium]
MKAVGAERGTSVSLGARAAWALALTVSAAIVAQPLALAALAGLALLSFACSGRGAALPRLVPAALLLGGFAFAINAVAQAGTPLFPDWPWSPSTLGVTLGARTGARLAITALACGWLVAATSPSSAADALAGALGRAFGRTGEALGLMGMVALRFGPLAAEEGQRLTRAVAQRAGRRPGLWAAPAIAVPLVLASVRRADRLAYVLAARHYGAGRRTPPPPRTRTWRDAAIVLAAGAVVAVAALARL